MKYTVIANKKYQKCLKGVTSLVLGADTAEQVKLNSSYFETKPISEEITHTIKTSFADIDLSAIMTVLSKPKN